MKTFEKIWNVLEKVWDISTVVAGVMAALSIVYVAAVVENPTNAQLADCILCATAVLLMRMNSLADSKSND